jgi:hypothetical protein
VNTKSKSDMPYYLIIGVVLVITWWFDSFPWRTGNVDLNAKPSYGETGAPKNCRAIIANNVAQYEARRFTAEEALASIDRNCGIDGYSWGR